MQNFDEKIDDEKFDDEKFDDEKFQGLNGFLWPWLQGLNSGIACLNGGCNLMVARLEIFFLFRALNLLCELARAEVCCKNAPSDGSHGA